MGIQTIKKPIKEFTEHLTQHLKIDEIIIFGSYALGEAKYESDIDIIVVSPDFEHIREDKRLQILDKAAKNILPEIQAWGFTPHELSSAEAHSTLGYARKTGIRLS